MSLFFFHTAQLYSLLEILYFQQIQVSDVQTPQKQYIYQPLSKPLDVGVANKAMSCQSLAELRQFQFDKTSDLLKLAMVLSKFM